MSIRGTRTRCASSGSGAIRGREILTAGEKVKELHAEMRKREAGDAE